MRFVSYLLLIASALMAQNPMILQLTGVKTTQELLGGQKQEVFIERNIPVSCINVAIDVGSVFGGDYAGKNVPQECQKSVVTVLGKVQPMVIEEGVLTVGEVEVLDFIQNKQGRSAHQYVLVDSRKRDWFEQMTIPSAINIPYDEIEYDADFPEDFERVKRLLGFEKVGDRYDFSNAKTALFFCNGAWCVQSPLAIKKLIKMGYPKERLLWYRGGMQDWLLFGFSVVKP